MSPIVITPTVSVATSLVLSDGQTELDLMGTPPWGLYLVELTPPVVPRENVYALAPEGQRRVRTRPQNAVGSARVRIDRTEDGSAQYRADLDSLQGMVESAHKRKGTLTFEPPNGQEVTYDIESCQITEAPADGPRMSQRMQEFVVEFECRPWGRLATITAFTDQAFTGPIDGIEIDAVDVTGHVDALAELTITDSSSANSDFVEFGLGQQGYNPDAPLLIEEDDISVSGDLVGTQPSGAGGEIVCTLTATSVGCCGTGEQEHAGRHKIAARIFASEADIWVRLVWRINRGQPSYGRWIDLTPGIWVEPTLAVIDLGEPTVWTGWIEAFAGDGAGTLFARHFYIIPAEVCGRVRWSGTVDQDHALWEDQAIRFSDEGAEGQSTGGAMYARLPLDGDTLRIPAATAAANPSLLVIRRRLYDIDSGDEALGLDADVTATLEITPRVALY